MFEITQKVAGWLSAPSSKFHWVLGGWVHPPSTQVHPGYPAGWIFRTLHQVLTSKKLGESCNKLKADLKMKMKGAKARLENLSRNSLLGDSKQQTVKSGPKVSNGEAKTRLRQVNHLVGNILNQGQRAQEQERQQEAGPPIS